MNKQKEYKIGGAFVFAQEATYSVPVCVCVCVCV